MSVVPGKPDTAVVADLPEPDPAEGAVLVQGLLVGICGTDREIVEDGSGEAPPGAERIVLGHESLGQVVAAPAGSGLVPGQHVMGVVRRPDPVPCRCCAAGRWDYCLSGGYAERGIKGLDGYGAQLWRVDPEFAVPVCPELGELGVLVEPASVVAKAWDEIDRVGRHECAEPTRVLVLGAGPIGLLAALVAIERGLDVHVVDRNTDGPKPRLAAGLGAHYSPSLDDVDEAPDIVVDTTGSGPLVVDVVRRCAPGGVICLTGIGSGYAERPAPLDALNRDIVLRGLAVVGSVNAARRHYAEGAEVLRRADRGWLEQVVSRRVPLSDWPDALHRRTEDVKVVVDLTQ